MRPKGFTLIEMVLAMSITTILLMGMSASLVIASRAVSDGADVVAMSLQTSDALGEINSDLLMAQAFLDRTTSSSVTFTVPDRDGDGTCETIKYWWTGASDGKLMRQINSGTEVQVAANVQQFALTYGLTAMAAEAESDSDDSAPGGKTWHKGRARRWHWGWFWDHRNGWWGHHTYYHSYWYWW